MRTAAAVAANQRLASVTTAPRTGSDWSVGLYQRSSTTQRGALLMYDIVLVDVVTVM